MAVNVRIELRNLGHHASEDQRDKAFKTMFAIFKRACKDADILGDLRRHESYESKGQKKRRKRKESQLRNAAALRDEKNITKIKDHFG